MRGNAIVALVGDADGYISHFFGDEIERSRAHDLLDVLPGALEGGRIVRDGLSKIVDPVRLAGGHDVVADSADFGTGALVFD